MLLSRFDKRARNIMVLMEGGGAIRDLHKLHCALVKRGKGASKNRPESREAWRCAPLTRFSSPERRMG